MNARKYFVNKQAEAILMNPPQFGRVDVDNWLVALAELVAAHGGKTVSEVDALLVKCVGDFVGGMVLKKILAWLSTVNRDYIWKSDRDWDAELGLSYDQMRRVRDKVLNPIITTYQKSARNRSTHYRLNHTALFRAIGKVLGLSCREVRSILGKAKSAFSANPRVHSGETQETLTKKPTNSTIKQTKKAVVVNDEILSSGVESVQLLLDKGFGKLQAEVYQALDAEMVQACIDDADTKRQANQIKKTYQAYLTGALNIQLKNQQERAKAVVAFGLDKEVGQTPPPAPPQIQGGEQNAETSSKFKGREKQGDMDEVDMPENVTPIWADKVTPDVPMWWKGVQGQLENQLPLQVWMYLKGLELVTDADEVVLQIPKICPEQIAKRYSRNIERVVTMARGVTSIRFVGSEV